MSQMMPELMPQTCPRHTLQHPLTESYWISSKRLLFKNIAHDGSFQHCTWLHLAVPGCTCLYQTTRQGRTSNLEFQIFNPSLILTVYFASSSFAIPFQNMGAMGIGHICMQGILCILRHMCRRPNFKEAKKSGNGLRFQWKNCA